MSADLFRTIVDPPRGARSSRYSALPLSIVTHIGALVALVVIPLAATAVLPLPRESSPVFTVGLRDLPLPPAPPPPGRPRPAVRAANPDAAPVIIPTAILPEPLVPSAEPGPELLDTVEGGVPATGVLIPQPIVEPPPPAPVVPIKVGGKISEPRKIRDVRPVYPEIALRVRVQGTVSIEAVIGPTGDVEQASIVASVALLDEAALAAVRQWKFTPTLLNGVPVPVTMTVHVTFALR
jgi:protein TonB